MGSIFDTHAHYDDEAFAADRDDILRQLLAGDVCGLVNQGTTVETSRFSVALAHQYEGVYAAVGLHPEYLHENSRQELSLLRELYQDSKVVAVGEIGLDYYYDVPKPLQQEIFAAQLALAKELSLPVVIHDREAHGDVLDFIRTYQPKGIVHCFSGSKEMALEVIKQGMYIGMGGVITFKNARKAVEVVQAVPLTSLVLETDCPYLTPVPHRGERNHSGLIQLTAERIAALKGLTTQEVLDITRENAYRVYEL